MVADLGGGTFDVSILDIDDGVIEVLYTPATGLGGDDFDKAVMDWMAAEFKKDTGIDLTGDKVAMQRLEGGRRGRPRSSCPASPPPTSTCPISPPTPPAPSTWI